MLSIDVLGDEDLQGTVKKFISALLPQENFESSQFSSVLQTLFRYVHLEEFEMEYRLILSALNDLNKIQCSYDEFEPRLERETFIQLLEVSIGEAVMRPELGVKEWLSREGLDANLNNEVVRETACQKVYQRCMDLYDECFELAMPSTEVFNFEPELAAALKSCLSIHAINTQLLMAREGVRIGRKFYKGFDDWVSYTANVATEIRNRLDEASDGSVVAVDSAESAFSLLSSLKALHDPIAKWDIPELDNYTPILKYRSVIVVAEENVGKTMFVVDKATNVLLAGGRVVFMTGETQPAKIYGMIVINYVWKKYGIVLEERHVLAPEECPPEIQKIIKMSIVEIAEKQNLILSEAFSYESCYDEMKALYDKYSFDLVVIDHSCALKGSAGDGSLNAKVSKLSDDVLRFKRTYPVCVMVTSHLSSLAKTAVHQGKEVGGSSAKGSQNLTGDADEVFVLSTDSVLTKQKLIKLENTKRRNASRVSEPIYLRTKFEVSALIYDESKQAIDAIDSLEKEQALADLEADSDASVYTL